MNNIKTKQYQTNRSRAAKSETLSQSDVIIECDGYSLLGPGAEKGHEWEGS